jgi:alpha-L-fucosidase 2
MKFPAILLLQAFLLPAMATASDRILMDDRPATEWQRDVYPIGNGRIGATLYGGVDEARLQFTVDSLWTGNENLTGAYNAEPKQPGGDHFGSHQNLGELVFSSKPGGEAKGYRRTLDLGTGVHETRFERDGVTLTRSAIASFPAGVVAWRIEGSKPGAVSGALALKGAHPDGETITVGDGWLRLQGKLINGLDYRAEVRVVVEGGKVSAVDGSLILEDCDSATVLLSADTNYVMDRAKGWMEGEAAARVTPPLDAAVKKGWKGLLDEHVADHRSLFDRVSIDLGTTPAGVLDRPLRERIDHYRKDARELPRKCLDPDLEELLFQYGRYLLIGCSRAGSLPANLQGVWNDKNKPAWFADYHTNINLRLRGLRDPDEPEPLRWRRLELEHRGHRMAGPALLDPLPLWRRPCLPEGARLSLPARRFEVLARPVEGTPRRPTRRAERVVS